MFSNYNIVNIDMGDFKKNITDDFSHYDYCLLILLHV